MKKKKKSYNYKKNYNKKKYSKSSFKNGIKKFDINTIPSKRYRYVIIGIVLAFLLLLGRIFYLQFVNGSSLKERAYNQQTTNDIISAKRGTIYDKNGTALAQNVSSYTLIAYLSSARTTNIKNPQHVVDKEYTAEMLSTVLDLSKEQILKYLSKENVYQTEFGSKGRGLTELTKDAILALGLPGIDFIETQKRYYPYGDFASYTLGYAKTEIWKRILGSFDIESMSWMSGNLSFCSVCVYRRHYSNFCTCSLSSFTSCKDDVGSVQLSGGYYVINGCQGKEEVLAGIAASVFILVHKARTEKYAQRSDCKPPCSKPCIRPCT